MKKVVLLISLLMSGVLVLAGCTAELGKVPSVEAETVDGESIQEAESSEESVSEIADSAPLEEEEPVLDGSDGWYPLFWEDLPEYEEWHQFSMGLDSSLRYHEEEEPAEEQIDEVNSPKGLAYAFLPTYVYETEHSGTVMGEEPMTADDAPEEAIAEASAEQLVEPSDAELTYGEAVDLASEITEKWTGKLPKNGWTVQYFPAEATMQELYYGGRSEFQVHNRNPKTGISLVQLDAITGEWLKIIPEGPVSLDGGSALSTLQYGKENALDTARLEEYLEMGRQFTADEGPKAMAKHVMEFLGVKVKEARQLPSEIRLPADGDPEYEAAIREQVENGEVDPWEYNYGIVDVMITTEEGDQICVRIDSVSREVSRITRGTHLESDEQWISVTK